MRITIPQPCSEKWNNMEALDGGRFCTACSKVVVDFTHMSASEITAYFEKRTKERICGRFLHSQIGPGSTEETNDSIEYVFRSNWSYLKKIAVVVVLYVVIPFSAFCQTKKEQTTNCNDNEIIVIAGGVKVKPHRASSLQSKIALPQKIPLIAVPTPITPKSQKAEKAATKPQRSKNKAD